MVRIAWLALAFLLPWSGAAPAAVEARTAHFRVITGLEAAVASAAAQELEAVRTRYQSLGLEPARRGVEPVAVVVFRDLSDLQAAVGLVGSRPGFTRAFHQQGADRDFIAVAWDAPGSPQVALAHEYSHQIFSQHDHPLWFREGFAEYLSHTEAVGNILRVGLMPPGFALSLLTETWIPLRDLLSARRDSAVLAHRNFPAQCWLLVHWLASQEADLGRLDAGALQEYIERWGVDGVEQHLRDHLRQPITPRVMTAPAPAAAEAAALRLLEEWELDYWVADLLREMGRRPEARHRLRRLHESFADQHQISSSLGAIEMDNGRYDDAERHLAAAVASGSADPRTHYRYSLLLMRPVAHPSVQRAFDAVHHARLARRADPAEPKYLLSEAQALMLAGDGTGSARLLAELAETPGWRRQAGIELQELQRRKQRQLALLQPPLPPTGLWPSALDSALPAAMETLVDLPPRSAVPETHQASASDRRTWPPPGTILLVGRISGVECRGAEKIVIVDSDPFRTRLRIDAESKLYFPPLKWKELPCDTRGWQVNAAYRPARGKNGVRGVLVALVF